MSFRAGSRLPLERLIDRRAGKASAVEGRRRQIQRLRILAHRGRGPRLWRASSSVPRIVPPPFTSSVVAGVLVLMPILAVFPVPFWKSTELMMSEVESHSGR